MDFSGIFKDIAKISQHLWTAMNWEKNKMFDVF